MESENSNEKSSQLARFKAAFRGGKLDKERVRAERDEELRLEEAVKMQRKRRISSD
jgi:hypothetical protein